MGSQSHAGRASCARKAPSRCAGLAIDWRNDQVPKQAKNQAEQALKATKNKAVGRIAARGRATRMLPKKLPAAGSGSRLVQRRWECLPYRVSTPSFARQHAQAAGAPLLALSCNPYQQLAIIPAQGTGMAGELVHVIPQRDAQVNALLGSSITSRWLVSGCVPASREPTVSQRMRRFAMRVQRVCSALGTHPGSCNQERLIQKLGWCRCVGWVVRALSINN